MDPGTMAARSQHLRTCRLRIGGVLLLVGSLLQAGAALPDAPEIAGPPLTLDEAVATALRLHPQVKAAQYSEAIALAGVGLAVAPWLPQVSGSAQVRSDFNTDLSASATSSSSMSGAAMGPNHSTRVLYGGQLQLTQLLYDFGRTSGNIAGSRAAARAARGDLRTAQEQLALAAVTAYYGVLQAEALSEVAARSLEQQSQRLQQAQSFFKIGTRPELDVLIARTAVAQAELVQVQTTNNIQIARWQLVQSLGVTDPAWLRRPLQAAPLSPLPGESRPFDELLDEALHQRPDYYALLERLGQAEQQVRTSRGAYFPILTLSATAGLNGSALGSSSSGTTSSSGVSTAAPGFGVTGIFGMSWPLFSGLGTLYDVRSSVAKRELARANLEALRQQVRSQLQQAMIALSTAQKSSVAAAVVQEQAEQQLAVATGRYRAGVGNAIEVGDAQVTATTARAQKVQTQYALALARANLQWQLGHLTPSQTARAGGRERSRGEP